MHRKRQIINMSSITDSLGGTSVSVALATIITTFISKKYELGMTEYGALFTVVGYVTNSAINYNYSSLFHLPQLGWPFYIAIGVIVFTVLLGVIIKYKNQISEYLIRTTNNNVRTVTLWTNYSLKLFGNYMKHYPQYFDPASNSSVGEKFEVGLYPLEAVSECGTYTKFNDLSAKVSGYYVRYLSRESGDGDSKKPPIFSYRSLTITLLTGKMSAPEYYQHIKKTMEDSEKEKQLVELRYVKIIGNREGKSQGVDIVNDEYIFYSGAKSDFNTLEAKYFSDFYFDEKPIVLNYVRNVVSTANRTDGFSRQFGMLLYGKPGCGKSHFIQRLALATQRHIVKLDILALRTKKKIYQIIESPYISDDPFKPGDVIFELDEFGRTLSVLYEQQESIALVQQHRNNHLMLLNQLSASPNFGSLELFVPREDVILPTCKQGMVEEVKDYKESKEEKSSAHLDNKEDKDNLNKTMIDQRISDIKSSPIRRIIDSMPELQTNNTDVTIEDLLSILQGVVTYAGAIFVATSNTTPEEYRRLYPKVEDALFRFGRLTPIHFKYLSAKCLNEISQNNFHRNLTIPANSRATICTAEILQRYLQLALDDPSKGFNYFDREMNRHVIEDHEE